MRLSSIPLIAVLFVTAVASQRHMLSAADPVPSVSPESAGINPDRLNVIDDVVAEALSQEKMPGCVVLVGRSNGIVFHKAYGVLQSVPDRADMRPDTVFDLASLTKPIATATSVMTLVEEGRVSLDEPVAKYIPEFGNHGKESITVRQLLIHQGGLIPDNALDDYKMGPEEAWNRINQLTPTAEPGTKFMYSDVGFLVLGQLVERVTGKNVHEYSRERIFGPLEMTETGYLPAEPLKARAAVTEQRDDRWMKGEVHDPRAWELGGIAGHAGLFSTATDLARYATMMLNHGELNGVRILKPETVDLMTTRNAVSSGYRCLGWDSRTGYSSNRGDFFSERAYGHGGFTGTAIWIDPGLDVYVIFLSNRVHPDGKGLVNPLAGRIGTIVGAAVHSKPDSAAILNSDVLNGIDVLHRDAFEPLRGRRIGLITNQTGLSKNGQTTIQLLDSADNLELKALFSPEHGIEGKLDVAKIADGKDSTTGLKVFSLYGETRKPTPESLQEIDTLVFDIQDIGCRFYTYISTMGNAMQAAAEHQIRFVVLDRVNPIGGVAVQGPILDDGTQSFVGYHTIPVRHGMTIGEIAQMLKAELKLDLDLQIIPVEGWSRKQWFDETGLTWINPSPNMRNLNEALLYPGVGLLEMTNLSVGRGTDTPFEIIGAPWIDGQKLATVLNQSGLRGLRFVPTRFQPDSSKFSGESCGGVQILITNRHDVDPLKLGIQLMSSLRQLYPEVWEVKNLNRLLSSTKVRDAVLAGQSPKQIELLWKDELDQFLLRRQQFLMYP